MITRREFVAGVVGAQIARAATVPRSVLVHEHILVDFIGADKITAGRRMISHNSGSG